MLTALRGCCRIYTELPSAATSIVGGDGTRFFRRSGIANAITICPRLRDGTHAAYIYPGVNFSSFGLGMCADSCLLAADYDRNCICTFALDGTELTTSPLSTHIFQSSPSAIAVCGAHVYVLEEVFTDGYFVRIENADISVDVSAAAVRIRVFE